MADTKHEVKVDIIADSKKFRNELKETAAAVQGFQKKGAQLSREGVQGDKKLKKASKEIRKLQQSQGKEALRMEKQLVEQIDKKAKKLNKINKFEKEDSKQRKQAVKELKELGKAHSEVFKARKQLMGLTRGERFKAGARAAGRVAMGAGVAGVGLGAAAIGGRIQSAQAVGGTVRTVQTGLIGSEITKEQLNRLYGGAVGRGFGPEATAQQAVALARGTGVSGKELAQVVTTAQQAARVGMMDPNQTTAFMGAQARAGFVGKRGEKDLEKTFTNAVASGLKRGRFGEFFQGTMGLLKRVQQFTAGDVGAAGVSGRLAMLGAGGASGLQGARGAQVAQRLDQAIRKPGGGEAGQAVMLRAFGFGKPGGGSSYTGAIRRQQRGFLGEGGAENLTDLFDQLKAETGGGEEFSLAASNITGLTMDQIDAVNASLQELKASGASEKEIQEKVKNLTEEMKPLSEKANEVMVNVLGEEAKHQSKVQKQLFDESEAMHTSLKELQDQINKIFAEVMPIVAKVLQELIKLIRPFLPEILQVLKDIRSGIGILADWFGKDKEVTSGKQAVTDIMGQVRTGELSPSEARKNLDRISKRMAQKEKKLKEDVRGTFGLGIFNDAPGMGDEEDLARVQSLQKETLKAMNELGSIEGDLKREEFRRKEEKAREASKQEKDRLKESKSTVDPDSVEKLTEGIRRGAKEGISDALQNRPSSPTDVELGGKVMNGDQGL